MADAEKLLAALSLDKKAREEGAAAVPEGGGGEAGAANAAAKAAVFSEDRVYKYCVDLEHAVDVRKREAEAGEAGAADLAAAAARAGDTPAFATWALLVFEQPITCPVDSLYIASRLDSDIHQNTCRLAFHGRLIRPINLEQDPGAVKRIKVFKMKQREGTVERVQDANTVIGKGMFKKETDLTIFTGMKVWTNRGEVGTIEGGFGKSGKYKVYFPGGVAPQGEGIESIKLFLRFKRYVFDKEGKKMIQD